MNARPWDLPAVRPGQSEIWELAEEIWSKDGQEWPQLSLGALFGVCLATFKGDDGKDSPSTARFFHILITESLYLIWKLREGEALTINEIHNRMKFGKQYSLAPSLVLDTWRGRLNNEEKLPKHWLREPEVLGDEAGIDNDTCDSHTVADCFVHKAFP
ncbi:hypothetical protein DFH07DRAFT_775525 [Mycena maculata]|uniref:Uncharacterized protein n=1 Tax=Mycena maculata TaxID=230809 RepID=A0AAD7ITX0_9AGAR|nr:hypothetical protein DFH07DRAFT_775525 [Mycena maculata]